MYGTVNTQDMRPYGDYNLRNFANELWKKLDTWIDESLGTNDLTTLYQPIRTTRHWSELKIDFEKWDARMLTPNDLEKSTIRTNPVRNPKLIEEEYLYGMIKDKMLHHVENFCLLCKQLLNQNEQDVFFNVYAYKAGLYLKAVVTLNSICAPLNISWIAVQPVEHLVFKIGDLCWVIWREKIVRVLGFRIRGCLTKRIALERQGQPQDGEAMANTLKSLVACKYFRFQEIKDIPDVAGAYSLLGSEEAKKLFLETYVFRVLFGNEYMFQTHIYVQTQARILEGATDMPNIDVMRQINRIIQIEERNASRGFHPYLISALQDHLTENLIIPNVQLFFPVFRDLLSHGQEADFSEFALIFRLLIQVEGDHLNALQVQLEQSFCARAQSKILALATVDGQFTPTRINPITFGNGLVEMYDQARRFITLAMQDNPNFYGVMNRGIGRALSDNRISEVEPDQIAKLLAVNVDLKMKMRNTTGADFNQLIVIVQLMTRREVFIQMFHSRLGRRLLQCPTQRVRTQFEQEMTEKFRRALNINNDNYNTMFNDMTATDEVTNAFLRSPAGQARTWQGRPVPLFPLNRQKLEIRCLTAPAWNKRLVTDIRSVQEWKLPDEANYVTTKFKETFEANNPAKIVTPMLTHSYADLEWCVGQEEPYRTYSFNNCNLPMYIVLTHFGTTDSSTFTEVQVATGLDLPNLVNILTVLTRSIPRPRNRQGRNANNNPQAQAPPDEEGHVPAPDIVLLKSVDHIGPGTVFTVNDTFNVPLTRIDFGIGDAARILQ